MSADVVSLAAPAENVLQSLEAEAELLGAVLNENSLFDAVADILGAADFSEPLHGRIFATALHETMAGRPANPVTLKAHFADDPAIKDLGGVAYLARLTGNATMLQDVAGLARHLRDLACRRTMRAALAEAAAACTDMAASHAAIADLAAAAMTEAHGDGLVELTAGECVENHMRAMAEGTAGITSGGRIPSFDEVVGNIRPKHLVLLAARPGMGKTATAMSYSIGAARAGHGVLFVSIEMGGEELGARAAADMCYGATGEGRVPYRAIEASELNEWQRERVSRAAAELDRMPLVIIDASSISPGQLSRLIRRQVRRFEARGVPLRLVVVDYIQRMRPDRARQKKYEEVSDISAALKDVAKENGVAVLALAQLSRDVEKRGDKRPGLADLRDSGQLEQDADTVVFLLRQEYYHRSVEPDPMAPEWPTWKDALDRMTGEIEFIVAKRRGGETGSARGQFHGAFQAVRG